MNRGELKKSWRNREKQTNNHITQYIMSKENNNSVKEAIKAYLDDRAKNDELFAKSYAKENKNIDECFEYVIGEVRKKGNAVYMTDAEVFGLAVHYYDEDDIKINKLPKGTKVSASAPAPEVQLTEEDKAKAHDQAVKEYKQQCIDRMRAAEEQKAKKLAERRKAEREKSNTLQPSLFDF